MAFIMNILSITLVVLVSQQVSAQLPIGFGGIPGLANRRGLSVLGMMTGQSMFGGQQQQQTRPYRTCIGQTAGGDELRVTFSERQGSSNWWESDLQVTADITSGSISGLFQLVATEFGRVDGVCESSSLGEILTEQSQQQNRMGMFNRGWWSQGAASANTIGRIGNSFELAPGKTVSLTDNINTGLTMDRITGGGMALCPVQQIVGNRCVDVISLCCPISRDSRPADQQVNSSVRRGGLGGGLNTGMGGVNTGIGGLGGINAGNGVNGGAGSFPSNFGF